jgi:hypothetical protein
MLTDDQRIRAVSLLQGAVENGQLRHGEISRVAEIFHVSRQAIHKLWKDFGGTAGHPLIRSPQNVKRKPRSGRPRKYSTQDMREHVRTIPLKERKTVRDLAAKLSIPKSTLHDMMQEDDNGYRRHSSALKPHLTEVNKVERVLYAIGKVDGECFKNMEDEVYVDEKWFYLTRDRQNYILLDNEPDPHRTVSHKSHIDKIMFLAATAKPRWDPHTRRMWDGKVGIWPFARIQPAQRTSARRVAGTPEWVTYNVNRDTYRDMLINHVLPAISEKWPRGTRQNLIRIQQDNTTAHIKPNDPQWLEAVANSGLLVELYNQPPNSPDTNINDLAFFASIQSLQHKILEGSNKQSIVDAVLQAYRIYPWKKLRNSFLTLQCCLNEIIESDGDNDYKIPHYIYSVAFFEVQSCECRH